MVSLALWLPTLSQYRGRRPSSLRCRRWHEQQGNHPNVQPAPTRLGVRWARQDSVATKARIRHSPCLLGLPFKVDQQSRSCWRPQHGRISTGHRTSRVPRCVVSSGGWAGRMGAQTCGPAPARWRSHGEIASGIAWNRLPDNCRLDLNSLIRRLLFV
jgi:hypothetical protein